MPTWSSPHTWVDGELVAATALNVQIRDNLNALMNPNNFDLQSNAAYSTTATTFTNITSTALVVQGGGPVMIGGRLLMNVSNNHSAMIVLDVDGTQSTLYSGFAPVASPFVIAFSELWTGLTVASHTISLKWKVDAGNQTAYTSAANGNTPLTFFAIEM